ncbi:hypothetical protein C9I98_19245 [Photobacterium sanctipauli]|uniref:Uncharacterized protein n=1 Tax=Photobacterium sanctipauli TaxID=1342794 RepID=A0A2T3NNU6_9GAMM|nr:hypothetical protein [Photobacterium sanctipauli]PSW17653.1 hypothetical protein C9I98_19245 [Photobacterium sanctipauli]
MYKDRTVILTFFIAVLLFSGVLLFAKDRIMPTFGHFEGLWYTETEKGVRFYLEFDNNHLNIYGQDKEADKFEVKYLSHYKKDVDGRIIIRQVDANADDPELKDTLDLNTNVISSIRLLSEGDALVVSFFNGHELKVYRLKEVQ